MATLTYTGTLDIVTCWCGTQHAIPSDLHRHAKSDPTFAVFCPLGHEWVHRKSDAQIEREKREELERRADAEATRLRAQLDQVQATNAVLRRSRSALKGEVTKARKRAARTQCPVADCKRTFAPTNMQRHVETEHPHWHPEPALEQA